MIKGILCIGSAILLGGCMSVGVQISQEQLSGFSKGKTSYEEVVSKLGRPTTLSTNSNGSKIAVYSYIHSQARPESFIPYLGLVVGGADSTITTANFIFDSKNTLVEYSLTESNYGTGTGIAAGTYRDRTPNQPKEAP